MKTTAKTAKLLATPRHFGNLGFQLTGADMKNACTFIALFLSMALPVQAQDDSCRDILADGTMRKIDLESSKYVKLAYIHRLYRMSETDAQEEMRHIGSFNVLGFGIVGDSDNYALEYQKFREIYEENFDLNFERNEEISLMSTGGDPLIVNAWSDCMKRDGMKGPRAYFQTKVVGRDENGIFGNLTVFFNPAPGQLPPPTVTGIEPALAYVKPDEPGQLAKGVQLVVNGSKSALVYFPQGEDDGQAVRYRQALVNIHLDGDFETLTASLPAFNERKEPVRVPWIQAGQTLDVSYPTFCNHGAENNTGCNYKVRNTCKRIGKHVGGFEYENGHFQEQFCDHGRGRCAVDFMCLHTREPDTGTVTVLKFQTLYPCNTGVWGSSHCEVKAKAACEVLGLEFEQAFYNPDPRNPDGSIDKDYPQIACKDDHLGLCDVAYRCKATKDMYQ